MQRSLQSALATLALLVAVVHEARADAASRCESLAVFGTTCARCHEAECSGRLTFDDPSRARAHVQRYTGPLADERFAQLVELLRVTKERCRFDAAAAASCGEPPWDEGRLRRVHIAAARAWFVPLGTPSSGARRLALRFDRDVVARVRISTAHFDVVHESSLATREHAIESAFTAPAGEPLFALVKSETDAALLALSVEADARGD